MEAWNETLESSPLDLETIRRRVKEISDLQRSASDISEIPSPESQKLLQECLLQMQVNFQKIDSDFSDFGSLGMEDLDLYLEHIKREFKSVEAENAKISDEIKALNRAFIEDSIQLEGDLEVMDASLKFIDSEGLDKWQADVEYSLPGDNQRSLTNSHKDCDFQILELDRLIEKDTISLNALLDVECAFKRVEAIRQIEDILSDVKVIEFEGNCIRVAMKTYFPTLEGQFYEQKSDFVTEPSVLDHELLIELTDGTMQIKNVEMFPNDVYIGEVVDAAKSLRLSVYSLSLPVTSSSLEWFVRKVQHRILLCTLRRSIVKGANTSRHSFEYSDRDETIITHLIGNIDAFIKVPQSWPLSTSTLKLVSLKKSDFHSQGISLSLLCKVKELVNSLDRQRCIQLSSFADAIEEILIQQKHLEL